MSQSSVKQPVTSKTKLLILGATGSVGESTLDVVRQHSDRYEVVALSANKNHQLLLKQCLEFKPLQVVLVDEAAADIFKVALKEQSEVLAEQIEVTSGAQALLSLAKNPASNVVMAAIVGAAGLAPTLTAAQAGKRILLANKESLVMSGELFMQAIQNSGAELLPIDSEHNAIFQCLPINNQKPEIEANKRKEVKRIILTASGGPFWERDKESFSNITPDEACKHPKWEMGRKISVDSATLMNKGLEVIEACLLFNLKPKQVEVIIHPQSIVHSMVEYVDGSVIAQMANPDMKIPVAFGLSWPERIESGVGFLDLVKTQQLSFFEPDLDKFPCLALAYQALNRGPWAMAALNAANEVAVQAFLDGTLAFNRIPKVIEQAVNAVSERELESLESVFEIDSEVRKLTKTMLDKLV